MFLTKNTINRGYAFEIFKLKLEKNKNDVEKFAKTRTFDLLSFCQISFIKKNCSVY